MIPEQMVAAQVDSTMKRTLHRSIESLLRRSGDSVHAAINAAMISAAIYNAAYYWYETNEDDNIEQLTIAVIHFINHGLQMKSS